MRKRGSNSLGGDPHSLSNEYANLLDPCGGSSSVDLGWPSTATAQGMLSLVVRWVMMAAAGNGIKPSGTPVSLRADSDRQSGRAEIDGSTDGVCACVYRVTHLDGYNLPLT